MLCRERGIPVVLNTAGNHHGSRYQWIHDLQHALGVYHGIVDGTEDYRGAEADEKNWAQAFAFLKKLIEGKQ